MFCLQPRGSPPSREGLGVMTEPAVNRTRLVPHLRRLPGGELRTLRDAGNYIAKLPKREHDSLGVACRHRGAMLVAEPWRRHHVAQDRDHASAVSGREDADALQEDREEISDRDVVRHANATNEPHA